MTDKYAKLREAAEKATPELIRDVATIQDLINSTDWREKTTSPKNANQAKQRCQAAWFRIRERVESAETAIWHSHANIERATALEADLAAEKARADAAEAERDELKAKDASKSKLLERFRDKLLNMCDHFEDEGDRVYFGSTNDPDELRDIARQMDGWKWDAIMGQTRSDPYADLRELRATLSTLTADRDALIRERDEAREALRKCRTNIAGYTLKGDYLQAESVVHSLYKEIRRIDAIARSALTNANAAEREGNAPFVFASRHNDATGECEPVEISPEKARRIYEKIATRRTPETKP